MRKALVVGINNYGNSNHNLAGCINDANIITELLERNGNGDVNFIVKKMLDVQAKGELNGHVRECFSGSEDVALFYFSGHGYLDTSGGYVVTPDCSSFDMGISMQEILNIINSSKCQNKVVILDCCHSGSMGSIQIAGQQLAAIGDGVTILTASRSEEPSMEIEGHGVFTSLLIDALNGGAADVTGYITPGGVYAYIDKALGPWGQRPVFKTNVTRFSPIRTVLPHVDFAVLRRITQYFSTPEQEFNLDPSFENTNATDVIHKIVEPYANIKNVVIFKDLQKLASVGLVVPCGNEHMYFAAMESKSCKLTSAGQHYWRLVKSKKI